MQFVFLHPFWALGALALVPLLAHLFSRTRPKRREFPSVLLLREAVRRVARVRKPRDWWLLILRTLAMAAIVLAFLQPWLRSRFTGSGSAKTVVLVVDVTASMGYPDGTRTRLGQATAAAEEVLSALPSNSRANIVWVQAQPESALPEPGPNLNVLRQMLQRATVKAEAGSLAAALPLALAQLSGTPGERELVVISDFQKSGARGVAWQMPPQVRLTRIAVGEGDAPNAALLEIGTEPERPIAGQEASLQCRVANYSGEPRRLTVLAEAGESRLSIPVEVSPWSETLAVAPVKFPTQGLIPLKASLGEDRFPSDDVRYGVAEVRGALEVIVAGPSKDPTAQGWARAARALEHVSVRRVEGPLSDGGRADVLLVAGWDGQYADVIERHVKGGGALVVQPAPGVRPPFAMTDKAPVSAQTCEAPGWRLRLVNEEDPLFALFAKGTYGDPSDARFRRRLPALEDAGTWLLSYEDNVPALTLNTIAPGTDHSAAVAYWNMDLGATDWTARSVYVSFFGEFLRYLAQHSGAKVIRATEPGQPLRFEPGASVDPKDVQLFDQKDALVRLNAALKGREAGQVASEGLPAPGSYRWVTQGNILERTVVNFPAPESDLRRLGEADMQAAQGRMIAGVERDRLGDLREGQPLWPWFVGLAMVCLLLEGLLVWHFAGRRKEAHA